MENNSYIEDLRKEFDWVKRIISFRKENLTDDLRLIDKLKPLELNPLVGIYGPFVNNYVESYEERLLLALSIIPHIDPVFLTTHLDKILLNTNNQLKGEYADTYMGKASGDLFNGILPTGLLYLFLFGGVNINLRLELIAKVMLNKFYLVREGIIKPMPVSEAEPILSNLLVIDKGYLLKFITNEDLFVNAN